MEKDMLDPENLEEDLEKLSGMFHSALDRLINGHSKGVEVFYKIPSWWKYIPILRKVYYDTLEDLSYNRFAISFYSYLQCVAFDDFLNFVKEKKKKESTNP